MMHVMQSLSFSQEQVFEEACDKVQYDLFKEALERDVSDSAARFPEFGIKTEKYRYKSIKAVAKKSSFTAARRFQDFGLTEPKKIRKIAHLTFLKEEKLRALIPKISNFPLPLEDRFDLALAIAKKDGPLVLEFFSHFNLGQIRDGRLFQIAQAAFQQHAIDCSKHIDQILYLSESERCELLVLRLKEDADKGRELTEKFKVTSLPHKVQAAELCAAYDGWGFSENVQHWGFEEEATRFQLAQKALSHPLGVLKFVANFRLTPEHVFDLFVYAITQKTSSLNDYLEQSGLDDKAKQKLALRFAVFNPQACLREIGAWNLPEVERVRLKALATQAG